MRTQGDVAVDKIHEAVRESILAGMSAADFKREAAQSWGQILKEDAKIAVTELMRR